MGIPNTYLTEARKLLREKEPWYIEAAYRAWTKREPVVRNGLRFMATNIGVVVYKDRRRLEEVGSHSARAVEAAWLALNARREGELVEDEELVDEDGEDNIVNVEVNIMEDEDEDE